MENKDMRPQTAESFATKYEIDAGSGCWNWTGAIYPNGYGQSTWDGRTRLAHRVSFYLAYGYWPKCIDHLCRNRACVNPKHMEAVDHKTNVLRGEGVTAHNARKTHCIRGHEFTPENTTIIKNGRECKTCTALLRAKYKKRPDFYEKQRLYNARARAKRKALNG